MEIDPLVLLTIVGMALVTYATRVSGVWLMNRVTLSRRTSAWLSFIPGSVLISIIAPNVLTGRPAEPVAALATLLVAWRTRNILLAMAAGVLTVLAVRLLLGQPA